MTEVMFAISIFIVTLLGFMVVLATMKEQNRILTQREQATCHAREILELIKNLGYARIQYSQAGTPVYLKSTAAGTDDPLFRMPTSSDEWIPLWAGGDMNSDGLINEEHDILIPHGEWSVTLSSPIVRAGPPQWEYRSVKVSIRWKKRDDPNIPFKSINLETYVAPGFGGL